MHSIHNQTYAYWECIIIDDGSSDSTKQVASAWLDRDKRFQYYYQPNAGLSSARNAGLSKATGTFIQFLDADDNIDNDKLSVSLAKSDGVDVIVTDFKFFTNKPDTYTEPGFRLTNNKICFEQILSGWDSEFVIPIHCGLFKANLFTNIRFNESLTAKEDWVMWLQIFRLDIKSVFFEEPMAYYRQSGAGMSHDKKHMHQNLTKAYQIIYSFLPLEFRDLFFTKAIQSLGNLLMETDKILAQTRRSKSYRLGNFFVRPFRHFIK